MDANLKRMQAQMMIEQKKRQLAEKQAAEKKKKEEEAKAKLQAKKEAKNAAIKKVDEKPPQAVQSAKNEPPDKKEKKKINEIDNKNDNLLKIEEKKEASEQKIPENIKNTLKVEELQKTEEISKIQENPKIENLPAADKTQENIQKITEVLKIEEKQEKMPENAKTEEIQKNVVESNKIEENQIQEEIKKSIFMTSPLEISVSKSSQILIESKELKEIKVEVKKPFSPLKNTLPTPENTSEINSQNNFSPEAVCVKPLQNVPIASPIEKPSEKIENSPDKVPSPEETKKIEEPISEPLPVQEKIKLEEKNENVGKDIEKSYIPPLEVKTPVKKETQEILAISTSELSETNNGQNMPFGQEIPNSKISNKLVFFTKFYPKKINNYMKNEEIVINPIISEAIKNEIQPKIEKNKHETKKISKKAEQFEIQLDLEEQMRKLQQKKIDEENKRREESMKMKQMLLKQLVSSNNSTNEASKPINKTHPPINIEEPKPDLINAKHKKSAKIPENEIGHMTTVSVDFENLVKSPDPSTQIKNQKLINNSQKIDAKKSYPAKSEIKKIEIISKTEIKKSELKKPAPQKSEILQTKIEDQSPEIPIKPIYEPEKVEIDSEPIISKQNEKTKENLFSFKENTNDDLSKNNIPNSAQNINLTLPEENKNISKPYEIKENAPKSEEIKQNLIAENKYDFPPLNIIKPSLVVTPKLQDTKGQEKSPSFNETGHFVAEQTPPEEDYNNASFDKEDEKCPIQNPPPAEIPNIPAEMDPEKIKRQFETFGHADVQSEQIAPIIQVPKKAEMLPQIIEKPNENDKMMIIDFGNKNMDDEKKKKQFEAFKERRQKQDQEKREGRKMQPKPPIKEAVCFNK